MKSLAELPRPYPDPKLYNNVLKRGFKAYPQREENYNRYQRSKRCSVVDYLPIKLDIENVSRCNFKCQMCIVSKWDKGQRARDMTLEEFHQTIDEQIGRM